MTNPLQGNEAWKSARLGYLTASVVADILPSLKKDKAGKITKTYKVETRRRRMAKIIAERVRMKPLDDRKTTSMEWGTEHEDDARDAYWIKTGEMPELAGFIPHDEIPFLGASPDGLIGDDGLIEIKCPDPDTHMLYVMDGVPPEKYRPQMMLQLIVTKRKWCDFISFDPEAGEYSTFIVRFEPSAEELQFVLNECRIFLDETARRFEEKKKRLGVIDG